MYQTMFNRKALKQRAKGLLGWGNPAMYLITLVYILATSWISNLADLVVSNPLNGVSQLYLDWYSEYMQSMTTTGTISQGSIDAFTQQLFSSLTSTSAAIGMLVALLIGFYSLVVSLGYYAANLRTMRGQENGGFAGLFSHFDMAAKIIWLEVLKFVFIVLWSMLFFIPGLVASYRYRLAEYCLLDDPDISALEAIRRSKKLMFGRKMDLFVTDLSFLGWLILQSLLVNLLYSGAAAIISSELVLTLINLAASTACAMFLTTYMSLTEAGFYLYVLGNPVIPPVQNGNAPTPTDPDHRIGGDPYDPDNGSSPYDHNSHNENTDDEGWNL